MTLPPLSIEARDLAEEFGFDLDDLATVEKVIAELERTRNVSDDPATDAMLMIELRRRAMVLRTT